MNWLKVGVVAVNVGGAALTLVGTLLDKKTAVNKLAESKEVQDLIAKKVAEALKDQV